MLCFRVAQLTAELYTVISDGTKTTIQSIFTHLISFLFFASAESDLFINGFRSPNNLWNKRQKMFFKKIVKKKDFTWNPEL